MTPLRSAFVGVPALTTCLAPRTSIQPAKVDYHASGYISEQKLLMIPVDRRTIELLLDAAGNVTAD